MKTVLFACLLLSTVLMSFASDKTDNGASASAAAPAKPSVIEGGNGVTLPPPPPTEAKPVTETVNGQTITDAYR